MRRWVVCGILATAMCVAAARVDGIEASIALNRLGFPSDTEQKVRSGEFVETSLGTSSERDLNVGIAFGVKQPPDKLAHTVLDDLTLERVDPGTIAVGKLTADAAPAEFAALKLTPSQLEAYSNAKPGDALNLSSEEVAALQAAGKDPSAVQDKVRELLIARYRAYRAKGLAGIAPYARDGSKTDPAADLVKVNGVIRAAKVLPPAFLDLLDTYPKGAPADLKQVFYWTQFTAHGEDTIALVHSMMGTFDGTPVAVQRQYYASTGYNAEQAVVGFLPAQAGTLVIYTNHTSTDQLAGFGSGAKRSIGRKLMASELKKLFEKVQAATVK